MCKWEDKILFNSASLEPQARKLIRSWPVTYIVACDRNWTNSHTAACFRYVVNYAYSQVTAFVRGLIANVVQLTVFNRTVYE